jgi:hypothetical protein
MQALFSVVGWFRLLGDRFLAAVLRTSVEENMAELSEATIAAKRRTLETALEALNYANTIDAGGDEFKAKLLNEFKADIGDITAIGRDVFTGIVTPDAARESLVSGPFGSRPSAMPSANGHEPKPIAQAPKPALPNRPDPDGPATPLTPRRRGRPPKHPRPEPRA